MTSAQTAWAILIAAQAVVNAPFLLNLILKGLHMSVSQTDQDNLGRIYTALGKIPALTAAAVTAANGQAAQDAADTSKAIADLADAAEKDVAPPAPAVEQ